MAMLNMSHAAQSMILEKMLHHQVQELWLKFYSRNPPHIGLRVRVVAKQAESALTAENHIVPYLQFHLAYRCARWILLDSE